MLNGQAKDAKDGELLHVTYSEFKATCDSNDDRLNTLLLLGGSKVS